MSGPRKKIKVMIVEDSRVAREFLHDLINDDPRLEVVAAVASAEQALSALAEARPDVISMDIRLPGMSGIEATHRIMANKPTPIVIVSADPEAKDLHCPLNPFEAGALSVIGKPAGRFHPDHAQTADRLRMQLVLMSQVKVVRQRFSTPMVSRLERAPPRVEHRASGTGPTRNRFDMLGLVASTGGPTAIQRLLVELGPDFPLPIVLVQHMTDSFLASFAAWLNGVSPLAVCFANDGEMASRGRVYMVPADRHLSVDATVLRLEAGAPVSAQRPSGTVLFQSMARSLGSRSLGALLTGMGDDGAAGLKDLRDAGGYTLAEDESTAVVYGMPAIATRLGAVCESLPLERMGTRIKQLASMPRDAAR